MKGITDAALNNILNKNTSSSNENFDKKVLTNEDKYEINYRNLKTERLETNETLQSKTPVSVNININNFTNAGAKNHKGKNLAVGSSESLTKIEYEKYLTSCRGEDGSGSKNVVPVLVTEKTHKPKKFVDKNCEMVMLKDNYIKKSDDLIERVMMAGKLRENADSHLNTIKKKPSKKDLLNKNSELIDSTYDDPPVKVTSTGNLNSGKIGVSINTNSGDFRKKAPCILKSFMRQKQDNSPKTVHKKIARVLGNTLKNVQKCYRSSGRGACTTNTKGAATHQSSRVNRTTTSTLNSAINNEKHLSTKSHSKKNLDHHNFMGFKPNPDSTHHHHNYDNHRDSEILTVSNGTIGNIEQPQSGPSPRVKTVNIDAQEKKGSLDRKRSRNKKKRLKTQPSPLRSNNINKTSRESLELMRSFGDRYIQKKRQSSYLNHNTAGSYNKSSKDLTYNNTINSCTNVSNNKKNMYQTSSSNSFFHI